MLGQSQPIQQLHNLAQTSKIQQRERVCTGARRGSTRVVSQVHSNGGVAAVGKAHDEVRLSAVAQPDDRHLLTIQWMMGMGDGH